MPLAAPRLAPLGERNGCWPGTVHEKDTCLESAEYLLHLQKYRCSATPLLTELPDGRHWRAEMMLKGELKNYLVCEYESNLVSGGALTFDCQIEPETRGVGWAVMSGTVRQPRTRHIATQYGDDEVESALSSTWCVSNRQLSKLPDCNAAQRVQTVGARGRWKFLSISDIKIPGDGPAQVRSQLQINHGVVVDHQMVVDKKDPLYVVNIKRAIASQLQLPILPADKYDDIVVQHDIFGACPTRFTFSADEKNVITTTRDLTMCQMPQVQGSQLSLLSFVKNFQLNVLEGNTDEMIYPFRSEVNCTYKLSGNRRIESSECAQHETFQPFISDGPSQTHPAAADPGIGCLRPQNKRAMSRGLQGRDIVDLSMTFEQTEEPETMAPKIFSQLNSLMNTYSALSQDLPPVNFRALVNLMRNAKESVLEEVLDSLILCRSSALLCPLKVNSGDMKPSLLQEDRSRGFVSPERSRCDCVNMIFTCTGHFGDVFLDGLLSCGSDACVATYATCLQRGLVGDVAGGVTLFNMALFYAPSPAVVKKIFEFCKVKSTRTCWLSLGSLVNKLSNSVRNNNNRNYVNEGKKVLKEILQHLRAGMGDTCRLTSLDPATQHYTLASLLDTVKAMGKLELNKELQKVFMDLLSDVMRPSSLRTVAFDYLLRLEDETSVRALLQAIQQSK
ncbi:hypothetical protein C0Q70_16416 [Pomacea canaliculata]|uniref:Vitellogenin domain-containing protein n=1 Tax=Pomacea canaliculata TaxID=400727 RepID=A0A2T7NPS7_POMCA|nr:hypothetical protein C0Q70_16416 [Pomacea canaliculata]